MSQSPFPEAAPDFSDPLGLLRACHGRIEQHCATLRKLVPHLREQGLDDEARNAMRNIHRYFTSAGQLHHQDEEQDLFPRLARQSLKLADLIHGLRQDHEKMEALWKQLEPLLARPDHIDDKEAFAALVDAFTALYHAHIARENEELLELAHHIFSGDELKKLGNRMAERRGVRINPL